MSIRGESTTLQPIGVGEDPITHYTRLFVRFLQLVHSTWDVGNYRWCDDDSLSNIFISGESPVHTTAVEHRPAILVMVGTSSWSNLVMDQFAGPLLNRNEETGQREFTPNYDPSSGAKRYSDLVSATATFNVLSSAGLEARRLAYICAYALRVFKKTLMRAGIHKIGDDIQIGAESPPGAIVQPDANEIILVPVTLPFFFQVTYTIEPTDKLLLNEVDVALRSELRYPAPGAVPIRGPGIHGKVIGYSRLVTLDQPVTAGPFNPPRPRKM